MKWNYWIIVAVFLLLIGLGGMAAFNTTIGQQQAELVEHQKELDQFAAEVYWTRLSLRAPPYYPPLEQIWISSGTGYRTDPMGGGTESLHKGIDVAAKKGTPVKAILRGLCVEHWLAPGIYYGKEYYGDPTYGGKIVLWHEEGFFSIYGHLSKTELDIVHEGKWVKAGVKIGEVGSTGISTGSHLHFEIVVDPLRYLEER